MSVIDPVHGNVHGPEARELLERERNRRNHQTLCPALPGELSEAGPSEFSQAVIATVDRSPHEPGAVGVVVHSSSGLVVPHVAARWPVKRLVYLAAPVPKMGKSALEQLGMIRARSIRTGLEGLTASAPGPSDASAPTPALPDGQLPDRVGAGFEVVSPRNVV